MADEPDSLVLRMLRGIDEKVDDVQKDISFLKERMVIIDSHAISVRREILSVEEAVSLQTVRLDFIGSKLGRIMRRLNLVDETSAPPDKADMETRGGTPPPD